MPRHAERCASFTKSAGRDANNAFQDTPAASAFKTVGVERISGKARLGGPLFVSYGLVKGVMLEENLSAFAAMRALRDELRARLDQKSLEGPPQVDDADLSFVRRNPS